jgi:hypothetical protein
MKTEPLVEIMIAFCELQNVLGMRNSATDYGTHWNIWDYRISQDKVRLAEEYGIFWYIGLGYIR